jgi:hypothetical protein
MNSILSYSNVALELKQFSFNKAVPDLSVLLQFLCDVREEGAPWNSLLAVIIIGINSLDLNPCGVNLRAICFRTFRRQIKKLKFSFSQKLNCNSNNRNRI